MHSLGAETFSHPAIGASAVMAAGVVFADVVAVVAGIVAAGAVASSVGTTKASVDDVAGVDDEVVEPLEHPANAPSTTSAAAATDLM